jgi:hypothetical protein
LNKGRGSTSDGQWRNGAISLHEVVYFATDNALDVPGSDERLADERGIHIELYRRLPAGDYISLKVGRYFERKAILAAIHAQSSASREDVNTGFWKRGGYRLSAMRKESGVWSSSTIAIGAFCRPSG